MPLWAIHGWCSTGIWSWWFREFREHTSFWCTFFTTLSSNDGSFLVILVRYSKTETFRWCWGLDWRLIDSVDIWCRVLMHVSHHPLWIWFSGTKPKRSTFVLWSREACSNIITGLDSIIFWVSKSWSLRYREAKNRFLHCRRILVLIDFCININLLFPKRDLNNLISSLTRDLLNDWLLIMLSLGDVLLKNWSSVSIIRFLSIRSWNSWFSLLRSEFCLESLSVYRLFCSPKLLSDFFTSIFFWILDPIFLKKSLAIILALSF